MAKGVPGMVIDFAVLETIELRIAHQWLRSSIVEFIVAAGIPSMGAQMYSQSRCRFDVLIQLL